MGIKIRIKPKGSNDTSESSRNIGSARVLSGKIFVLAAFVGPSANPWKPSDITLTKTKLLQAESWLKAQALRYGKSVEFVNTYFGSDGSFTDNAIPPSHNSPGSYEYPSTIVRKMGFASQEAFLNWVTSKTGCDQSFCVIFPNAQGRSYASPVTKELFKYDPRRYNLESCMIYRYYTGTYRECMAAHIAHEILHLFGAWDLYKLDEADQNRFVKTQQMFPNSIMIDAWKDIWYFNIDEINAWLVGLKDEGKDWYRWFEPGQDGYE